MATLRTKIIIQKLIDLESIGTERQRRYSKILVPISVSIIWILFGLSLALGVFLNDNENFGKTSITICGFCGTLSTLGMYWYFLVNQERIYSLLDGMQDIANDNCK